MNRRGAQTIWLLAFLASLVNPIALALDDGPDRGIDRRIGRAADQYCFDVWQTEEGLPHNTVHAILQTRDGYLWLATEEGLVRFDGMRFSVFDKQNTGQIKSNRVQVLFEDRNANLWIGTAEGLYRLKDGGFTAFTTTDGLAGNSIGSLYESRNGDLWIGGPAGLTRFRDGKFTAYTTAHGIPAGSVGPICEDLEGNLWVGASSGLVRLREDRFSLYGTTDGLVAGNVRLIREDSQGALWIGASGGLSRFKDGRFISYTTKQGLTNDRVWSIHEDREGSVWVGTDDGLNRFRDGKLVGYHTADGLAAESVWSIHEDHHGVLWLGTPGGLTRMRDGKFTSYRTSDGLSSNIVLAICEDNEGSLWIGTEVGGLNRLKDRKFVTWSVKDGLADERAWAVLEDRSGGVWIGSYGGGLSHFTEGGFTNFTMKDGLPSNIVRALHEDRDGNVWLGTPAGLARFKNGRFTSYGVEDGLPHNAVSAIGEDSQGALWVGTLSGLTRIKDGRFSIYATVDGLSDDSILSIYPGSGGSLWIGTREGGLNRFQDGRFTAYATKDGLSDNTISTVYEDGEETVWIGTRRGGLNRFKDGKFTSYSTKQGLIDDSVFNILDDGRGSLWISGEKGISRISKNDLEDVATHKTELLNVISYDTSDGLTSKQCGSGQPAAWKAGNGNLWFATVKGVAMVDPTGIEINQSQPPVVIEQVLVDGQPLTAGETAEIPAGADKFEFHYTGLSLGAPEKVRFKYKLEGFDERWVDANTQRIAYYTNIRPGAYRFKVIARNGDGIWNEAGAAYEFNLRPYFYQTYWFYGGLAAVVGLTAWGLYLLRIRQVKARFSAVLEERSRMAREIHDTLAQGLIGIRMQLEAGTKALPGGTTQTAQRHLQIARSIVNLSLAEARRFVWDLRSPALERGDLATALSDFADHLKAHPSVKVDLKVSGVVRRLPGPIEMNILRIGQEALTNAIKHAGARQIHIEIAYEAASIRLSVGDDGCGFDPEAISSTNGHFGLIGMRERANQINGRFVVTSHPGNGTRIVVIAPC